MQRLFKFFKGMAHALRKALIARRIARVRIFMERERCMHLQHMAQLRAELDALELRQIQAVAGTHHWGGKP